MIGVKGCFYKKIFAFILVFLFTFATVMPNVTANAAEAACTIKLEQTTGTVSVMNSASRALGGRNDMRLLNGYQVKTEQKSYAWLSLDSTKAAKLDAKSNVSVRSMGRKLELLLKSGNLFFNVTKKLDDKEEMNIRTSTMITGIRGTVGWVGETKPGESTVAILEGAVECKVTNPSGGYVKSTTVKAGEVATFTAPKVSDERSSTEQAPSVEKKTITVQEIPGSVLTEVVKDEALAEKITAATDSNVDLTKVTVEEAEQKTAAEEKVVEEKEKVVETAQAQQESASTTTQQDVFKDTSTATTETNNTTNNTNNNNTNSGGGSGGGGGSNSTSYCNLTVPLKGTGFTISPDSSHNATSTTSDKSVFKLTRGATFKFTLSIADGYYAGSSFGVSGGGNKAEMTAGSSGTYSGSFKVPSASSCELSVSGILESPKTYCKMYVPTYNSLYEIKPSSGFTASASEQDVDIYTLAEGTNFTFTVTLGSGCYAGDDFVVKADGKAVTTKKTAEGVYSCSYTIPTPAPESCGIIVEGVYNESGKCSLVFNSDNAYSFGNFKVDGKEVSYENNVVEAPMGKTVTFDLIFNPNYTAGSGFGVEAIEKDNPQSRKVLTNTGSSQSETEETYSYSILMDQSYVLSAKGIVPLIYGVKGQRTVTVDSGSVIENVFVVCPPSFYSEWEKNPSLVNATPTSIVNRMGISEPNNKSEYKSIIIASDIAPASMSRWFSGFTNVTEIKGLDKIDISNVSDTSYMFSGCTKLITISCNSDWSNLETITNSEYMFSDCTVLLEKFKSYFSSTLTGD
nr:BspA family leucine-rich repeat surface protein [Lachnospiraceae bacterium]